MYLSAYSLFHHGRGTIAYCNVSTMNALEDGRNGGVFNVDAANHNIVEMQKIRAGESTANTAIFYDMRRSLRTPRRLSCEDFWSQHGVPVAEDVWTEIRDQEAAEAARLAGELLNDAVDAQNDGHIIWDLANDRENEIETCTLTTGELEHLMNEPIDDGFVGDEEDFQTILEMAPEY